MADPATPAQAGRQPEISVATWRKDPAGNLGNGGSDDRRKGHPRRVEVHDFEDKQLGHVVPRGVDGVGSHAGWGIRIGKSELALVDLEPDAFHPGWGDTIASNPPNEPQPSALQVCSPGECAHMDLRPARSLPRARGLCYRPALAAALRPGP